MSRLYEILNTLADRGAYFSWPWTGSSVGPSDRVSPTMKLPKGRYIVVVKAPVMDPARDFMLRYQNVSGTMRLNGSARGYNTQRGNIFLLEVLSKVASFYVVSASANRENFSYLERGGFRFVKIA